MQGIALLEIKELCFFKLRLLKCNGTGNDTEGPFPQLRKSFKHEIV